MLRNLMHVMDARRMTKEILSDGSKMQIPEIIYHRHKRLDLIMTGLICDRGPLFLRGWMTDLWNKYERIYHTSPFMRKWT
jgi:hypothetical protein